METPVHLASLIDSVEYLHRPGVKTTVCLLTTKTGFELVGTSSCVNPADFNKAVGEHWAYKDALDKLGEFYAYSLHQKGVR